MPTRTRTPRTTTNKKAVASTSAAPVFSEAPEPVKTPTVRRTTKAKTPAVKTVEAAPVEKAPEVVEIPAARKSTRRVAAPVEVRKPAKGTWAIALRLAGGNVGRLSVNQDGSVLVRNK